MSGAATDKVQALLATKVTEGLTDSEGRELDRLLAREPELDLDGFERAAAALDLAWSDPEARLPEAVRRRLLEKAPRVLRQGGLHAVPEPSEGSAGARSTGSVTPFPAPPEAAKPPFGARPAWLAAAACLALAVAGWWPRAQVAPPQTAESETAVESRAELLAADADVLRVAWQATEDPWSSAATGDVVWSGLRQQGFMTFRGLAPNDPSAAQYQLWIFDRAQDERYPVDGGVFDVPAGAAEVVVPIDAKLAVDQPFLFAVTVERPGGVVVSSRERIVLLAEA